MPTEPKTLTNAEETQIAETVAKLRRLEQSQDLMPNNTYRALQRGIIRDLVKLVAVKATLESLPVGRPNIHFHRGDA